MNLIKKDHKVVQVEKTKQIQDKVKKITLLITMKIEKTNF